MKAADIKKTLLNQLAKKGAKVNHFADMINDYISFWETKNALTADIKKRGVMYEDYSSVGVKMQKNNPSVKELVMVNRQMLTILKELGLTTDDVGGEGDDEL